MVKNILQTKVKVERSLLSIMASINVYSILVVFLVATGAVIATEEDDIIKKYNCESETKMSLHCVMEIFSYNDIFLEL